MRTVAKMKIKLVAVALEGDAHLGRGARLTFELPGCSECEAERKEGFAGRLTMPIASAEVASVSPHLGGHFRLIIEPEGEPALSAEEEARSGLAIREAVITDAAMEVETLRVHLRRAQGAIVSAFPGSARMLQEIAHLLEAMPAVQGERCSDAHALHFERSMLEPNKGVGLVMTDHWGRRLAYRMSGADVQRLADVAGLPWLPTSQTLGEDPDGVRVRVVRAVEAVGVEGSTRELVNRLRAFDPALSQAMLAAAVELAWWLRGRRLLQASAPGATAPRVASGSDLNGEHLHAILEAAGGVSATARMVISIATSRSARDLTGMDDEQIQHMPWERIAAFRSAMVREAGLRPVDVGLADELQLLPAVLNSGVTDVGAYTTPEAQDLLARTLRTVEVLTLVGFLIGAAKPEMVGASDARQRLLDGADVMGMDLETAAALGLGAGDEATLSAESLFASLELLPPRPQSKEDELLVEINRSAERQRLREEKMCKCGRRLALFGPVCQLCESEAEERTAAGKAALSMATAKSWGQRVGLPGFGEEMSADGERYSMIRAQRETVLKEDLRRLAAAVGCSEAGQSFADGDARRVFEAMETPDLIQKILDHREAMLAAYELADWNVGEMSEEARKRRDREIDLMDACGLLPLPFTPDLLDEEFDRLPEELIAGLPEVSGGEDEDTWNRRALLAHLADVAGRLRQSDVAF